MDYTVVYEVTQETPDIWWQSLIFVFVGLGMSIFNIKFNKDESIKRKFIIVFGFVFAGLGLLFSLIVIPSQILEYRKSNELYESSSYKIVEGKIENFAPMPYGGRMNESFTVNGILFEYSDFDASYHGFNNAKSHGGPITGNGQEIKIGYITKGKRNVILRIETLN